MRCLCQSARGGDGGCDLSRPFQPDVRHGDPRTQAAQLLAERPADPGTPTGHDHDLVSKHPHTILPMAKPYPWIRGRNPQDESRIFSFMGTVSFMTGTVRA